MTEHGAHNKLDRTINIDHNNADFDSNEQERPAVADKPARRLRNVCTVYVRAVQWGCKLYIASLLMPIDSLPMVSY